jgi:hypothetical protein
LLAIGGVASPASFMYPPGVWTRKAIDLHSSTSRLPHDSETSRDLEVTVRPCVNGLRVGMPSEASSLKVATARGMRRSARRGVQVGGCVAARIESRSTDARPVRV